MVVFCSANIIFDDADKRESNLIIFEHLVSHYVYMWCFNIFRITSNWFNKCNAYKLRKWGLCLLYRYSFSHIPFSNKMLAFIWGIIIVSFLVNMENKFDVEELYYHYNTDLTYCFMMLPWRHKFSMYSSEVCPIVKI